MHYLYLALAIFFELVATNLLKASQGFSKWPFTIGTILTYGLCYYMLALSLKGINLSIAYAIWCGIGIIGTVVISVLLWQETVNLMTLLGIALILIGVVLVNLFGSGH